MRSASGNSLKFLGALSLKRMCGLGFITCDIVGQEGKLLVTIGCLFSVSCKPAHDVVCWGMAREANGREYFCYEV